MSAQQQPAGRVSASAGAAPLPRSRLRGLDPELGVSAFLLALGILVLVEATQITTGVGNRGPVGPKAIPVVVGVLLLVIAVCHAIDVLRGGHGEAEAGEDVELGAPADWKTVAMLAGAFIANILLIERLGWALSGSLMFYLSARALGSHTPVRDVPIALAMGFGSYLLFANALDISLPQGVLEGLL